jgi:hypothetical protein
MRGKNIKLTRLRGSVKNLKFWSKKDKVPARTNSQLEEHLRQMSSRQMLGYSSRFAGYAVKAYWQRHRVMSRLIAILLVAILVFSIVFELYDQKKTLDAYNVGGNVASLLERPNDLYAEKLTYRPEQMAYIYNEGFTTALGEVAGQVAGPRFTAEFKTDQSGAVTTKDVDNQVSITLTPKYKIKMPKQDKNRLVYPIRGRSASVVYSVRAASVKEDIILFEKQSDEMTFDYNINLSESMEARLLDDNSIGIFGVDNGLLGNVSTASDADAELLQKARQNSKKTKLLFAIPAPIVKESGVKKSQVKTWYELDGNLLRVRARGLSNARYPLSIDPTIYIETAAKLMRGNNETNTDFDVANDATGYERALQE